MLISVTLTWPSLLIQQWQSQMSGKNLPSKKKRIPARMQLHVSSIQSSILLIQWWKSNLLSKRQRNVIAKSHVSSSRRNLRMQRSKKRQEKQRMFHARVRNPVSSSLSSLQVLRSGMNLLRKRTRAVRIKIRANLTQSSPQVWMNRKKSRIKRLYHVRKKSYVNLRHLSPPAQ